MPLHYYHKSTLRSIARVIGTMEKIDYTTENANIGKFARVAIKVDLQQLLISRFKIDGRIQQVEYEDLQTICYLCGRFGHIMETYTDRNIGNEGNSKVSGQRELMNNAMPKETPVTGHNFGP